MVEEAQEDVEEGQSVRYGAEDRDVGRNKTHADRRHEAQDELAEEVVEEAEKPDYLDLDKDGDKEESMKDAAKEVNEEATPVKKEGITVPQNLKETIQKALRIAKGK